MCTSVWDWAKEHSGYGTWSYGFAVCEGDGMKEKTVPVLVGSSVQTYICQKGGNQKDFVQGVRGHKLFFLPVS